MEKTVEILNELKEQIALQFVEEYEASNAEAHRIGNVIVRAIEAVVQRHSGE